LPTSSGNNYDADIENIYAEIESLSEELDNVLANVDDMLAEWEAEQEAIEANNTEATDETTRWTAEPWVDSTLAEAYLQYSRIEDEDDYTMSLYLTNRNHSPINQRGTRAIRESLTGTSPGIQPNYLYYETEPYFMLWKATDITTTPITWENINFSSIYSTAQLDGITIVFMPKSSDRVIVDDDRTSLDSISLPFLDWDTEVKNRNDGTCKRIEAETFTRFTLPVPTFFYNYDPEQPSPVELRLDFELAYK